MFILGSDLISMRFASYLSLLLDSATTKIYFLAISLSNVMFVWHEESNYAFKYITRIISTSE